MTVRLVHLVCCDDGLAVCGTDVTALADVPDDTVTSCPLCATVEAERLPCDDPCCPHRQIPLTVPVDDPTGTLR